MVGVPHGMTYWTPQTRASEKKCVAPYYYEDIQIHGFRATHWLSGGCVQDYGSFTLMPVAGPLRVAARDRASDFRHTREVARPSLYQVTLDSGVVVRMSGRSRSGIFEFRFPKGEPAYIVFEPNSDEGLGQVVVDPQSRTIHAENPVHRIYQGHGKRAGFSGHAVVVFDQPFAEFGTFAGTKVHPGTMSAHGPDVKKTEAKKTEAKKTAGANRTAHPGETVGAYVRFDLPSDNIVRAKMGTSFTDIARAKRNLEAEIPEWSLAAVHKQSQAAWSDLLGRVHVEGSRDDCIKFYTSLYHALLHPRTMSDTDGSFPAFSRGNLVEEKGRPYYGDFSAWDTFRAVHPLLTLLAPKTTRDLVRSLVRKGQDGGWMPTFPMWNSYTSAMIGDHLSSIIADAYVKGVTDFDAEDAFRLLKQNAHDTPPRNEYVDGKGRRALPAYVAHGYLPLEEPIAEAFHEAEQVSRTLEYAYNDFALAQLGRALGKDVRDLEKRATNYRNVFDTSTGFMRGRHRDGRWATPFDPAARQPYFTEGTAWHYTFFVPHDVAGLVELMGRETFVERLRAMFDAGYYWHGNEPGHHVPFLFVYAGEAWRTQDIVRRLQDTEYGLGPGGITGNDDAGQLSAWFVLTALGLYPVAPGFPYYVLTSPLFEKSTLHLGEKKFVIRAKGTSSENRYIQSATLNGQPFTRAWIEHETLLAGGELKFSMGSRPNEEFGKHNLPPSMSAP